MLTLDQFRTGQCPICTLAAHSDFDGTMLIQHGIVTTPIDVTCDRCGRFSITYEAALEGERLKASTALSGIAREWTESGRKLEVNKDNLRSLINLAPRTLKEKRQRLLQTFVRICPEFEREYVFRPDRDYPLAHVASTKEFIFVLRYLSDEKLAIWTKSVNNQLGIILTPKGWEEVDAIEKPAALREKAFVAMWFSDEVKAAYDNGIAQAIKDAGYLPIRIDLKEHTRLIVDEILAEIKESRFVVADFTDHRRGVYFEAGYALGFNLDVIWTCRKDQLNDLHFDLKGFNVVDWQDENELRTRLFNRIRAIVGFGPLHDPTAIGK
jgi:nucleoside 2-deoxyribosyltransferase